MSGGCRPSIWFDTYCREAVDYCADVFPGIRVDQVTHHNAASPERDGQVLTVNVWIGEQKYIFVNGGPEFSHSENFSIEVLCYGQDEIDRYWNRLVGDGGQESQCGWCNDKYGVSWQIVPQKFYDAMIEDPAVTQAMMGMRKPDVAVLEAAATEPRG